MKLLLHTCCAPCLEYPYQTLTKENVDFVSYFYNPNIQPDWEYGRRKKTLMKFAELNPLRIIFSDPVSDQLSLNTKSNEEKWQSFPADERCRNCYRIRFDKSAQYAAENNFDSFSTTLMGSIYQNHALICEIGYEVARKHGINFYNRDFRDGFRIGQSLAIEQELYRQKYCGCICSLNSSALKNKILASIPVEKI